MARPLSVDPIYEALVPRLTAEEFAALKDSVREEGLHYPIVINPERVVLDGHHRFRACRELGLTLKEDDIRVKKFSDKLLERRFVITANLRRRQLTDFQKAELAIPLLEIEKELAKKRQGTRTDLKPTSESIDAEVRPIKATGIVAKEVGLSEKTLERAINVIQKAPEAIKERARTGEISISKAYERTQMYANIKASSLRDLVGPDRAAELSRLDGTQQDDAVQVTLEKNLGPEEVHVLVEGILGGIPVDESLNRILSSRLDLRTERYKERKAGITRVVCILPDCKANLAIQHMDGKHFLISENE